MQAKNIEKLHPTQPQSTKVKRKLPTEPSHPDPRLRADRGHVAIR